MSRRFAPDFGRVRLILLGLSLFLAACQTSATPTEVPTTTPPTPSIAIVPTATSLTAIVPTVTATVVSDSTQQNETTVPLPSNNSSSQTLTFENFVGAPDLDLYDLIGRLRPDSDLTPPPIIPREPVGHRETFWAINLDTNVPFQVSAVLRIATEHADFYVEEGLTISDDSLNQAARIFEESVYPEVTGFFQPSEIKNDARPITLLHLNLPSVAGYYDSTDEYPSAIYPYTNRRRMLYLNAAYAPPGSSEYISLLAHELQHAIHAQADPTEEVWVNEGLSVLAGKLFDGSEFVFRTYTGRRTPTQINIWPVDANLAASSYGAAGLLMQFLFQYYPDQDGTLQSFVREPLDGLDGLDAYLNSQGHDVSGRELLSQWAAANYLDGRSTWDPYPDREVAVPATRVVLEATNLDISVTQFAPSYVALNLADGDYFIRFTGEPVSPLLPSTSATPPLFWWSGGDDAGDATLTRRFDLRDPGSEEAVLDLWLWYDLEEDWDFAYVLVSVDQGTSWQFLETSEMVSEDANALGQAFGPGFSGWSGGWINQEIDLSAFVGRDVLVRLEYVTDGAVNMNGFVLGGASLPAIDYQWNASEGDGEWESDGFYLNDDTVKQEFNVHLLLVGMAGDHKIVPLVLDGTEAGELLLEGLGADYREATLMVFPTAPATRQPASISIQIEHLP